MKRLEKFNIDEAASEGITSGQVRQFLEKNSKGFIFQKFIERARYYSDLTFYYLEASYISEEIAKLGTISSFKIDIKSSYHPIAQFKIIPNKIEELHSLLEDLLDGLRGDTDDDQIFWLDTMEEYRENLKNIRPKFPELIDDYYANLIEGEYYQYANEADDPKKYLTEIKNNYPEHIFGFWRCSQSEILHQDFYVSTESWIVPPGSELSLILKKHSGINKKDHSEQSANFFSINGGFYVINENYIVKISYPALLKAFQCIAHVYSDEQTYHEQHNWLYHLSSTLDVTVSDFANYVKFNYNGYRVLLWNQYKMTFSDIINLNKQASQILKTTANLIGLKESISCDWLQLNDESFEELCYDLIYYDPRFDNKTIRKMGKSRSRDGGRDIVVYTHSRPRYEPEKYIFQCKLIKPNSSLTASKVLDVSDIIEQYEADGYGIFTSGVIDATLFDKIDKIASKRKLKTVLSSKYELERDLSMLLELKDRYFK